MRSDTHNINGLLAYKLLTTESINLQEVTGASDTNFYIGIRVYIRHIDESETEITTGTSVAIAHIGSGIDGVYTIFASWDCPETALVLSDAIKIDVRCLCGLAWDEGVAVTIATFITEQLGATQLDANTWTVYYRIRRDRTDIFPPYGVYVYDYYFRFGVSGDDSYITGFKWISGVTKSWHNIATWDFNLTARSWLSISTWDFNLSAMQWKNIVTWTFDLVTRHWNNIAEWTFQTITRSWKNIINWNFDILTLGWHTIAYWIFRVSTTNIPILFMAILFVAGVVLLIFILSKRKD